jgi:hypothetical protein
VKNFSELKQAIKDNAATSKDYFVLEDDGDKATVVFLHASEDDIDWGKVYEVKLPIEGENKSIKKYVLSKGDDDPLAEMYKTKIRALFQLVTVEKDGKYSDVKVWDRGPKHITQLLTYMEAVGPLNTYPITIVRNGKKGSTQTTYQMITGRENIDPEAGDLPKPEDLVKSGRYILDLSTEDMTAVANGTYRLPAFDKNKEETSKPKGDAFGGVSTVKPKEKKEEQSSQDLQPTKETTTAQAPPKPVFNEETGQYEMPAKPKKEAPTPPEPKLVDGEWHTPVRDNETGKWSFPTLESEKKDSKTTMF